MVLSNRKSSRYMRPVRRMTAILCLLAFCLSSLHAGPAAAHDSQSVSASFASHDHAHHGEPTEDSESDSSTDVGSEIGHHHAPVGAAPQSPHGDLEGIYHKQLMFAFATSLLREVSPAPPLDPPIA